MANTLPSPPTTPSPSSPDLATQLDTLLEPYLSLLDTYTTLRAQLSAHFSAGFLSLAHANRNAASVLGAGRRFGEEGYDERMKARRGVRIERVQTRGGDNRTKPKDASLKAKEDRPEEESSVEPSNDEDVQDQHRKHGQATDVNDPTPSQQPASRTERPPMDEEESLTPSSDSDGGAGEEDNAILPDIDVPYFSFTDNSMPGSPSTTSRDPLLWFTALPPPSLRQTQNHFTSSLTTISNLLTTISKISALEKQIWDVRKEMGILEDYNPEPGASKTEELEASDSSEGKEREGMRSVEEPTPKDTGMRNRETASTSLPSPSKQQNLVSRARPAEPRSRVLKMD